jgi:heat shock protein HslJ
MRRLDRHHPTAVLVALVAAFALVATGCGDEITIGSDGSGDGGSDAGRGAGGADGLGDTSWVLAATIDGARSTPATAEAAALKFQPDETVTGSTGCNSFAGTYSSDGDSVSIELGPVTQRACVDPAAEAQERALLEGLPTVTRFEITDDGEARSLVLGSDDADLFRYDEAVGELAGTAWQVTGVNNGRGGVETTAATSELTLEFGDDGTVSGFAGCNRFTGRVEADGDEVELGPLATTKMACPDEAASALESQYLAALAQVSTFDITGTTLTLWDAGGSTQVTATLA